VVALTLRIETFILLFALAASPAYADAQETDTRPAIAPDIREDESSLKLQRGDFVVVPIPFSNPTLDTGLVAGAAYFYPQTEEQKKIQPASVTAAGAMYSSNTSKALALVQQNYWNNDKWRFTGAIGAADLRLSLLAPDETPDGQSLDWHVDGQFVFAKLARKVKGNWYGGFNLRNVIAKQDFESSTSTAGFDTGSDVRSTGLGVGVEFDSRDMPINTYSGRYFEADALFNDEALGSDNTYQSYSLAFRSYHEVHESVVLAWEMQGCQRAGSTPLWDACTIKLRGFDVTDYLGKTTVSGQLEARWQLNKRWGLAGFAGVGQYGNSYSGFREHEAIPSYGAGVRFLVLAAKRINLRVDYAMSRDSDAIHVSVGEAF
jgi:hypothetical protein